MLSQTDIVVAGVKDMITSGRLSAGARLPIEKDLASELGVSRGSLREGVRALAIMGVLETRQGDGTYVTSLDPGMLLAPMSFAVELQSPEAGANLQTVRRVLESEAAFQAATRISEADLAAAGHLLSGMEETITDPMAEIDYEHMMDADIAFHRLIARASGNSVLESLIEALASRTIRDRLWRAISEDGAVQATRAEHRAILAALQKHDAEGARIRMASHLYAVEDFLQDKAAGSPST
ncbi:FadR/GntR family transcriptional regulator [Subtercola endophyticus]|uniref:FadR/GntR family transcriptional regulator n=1 Tax=Subtercola endophyticus TaxID=2895559 RepID=UPI001E60726F|nr:FadR/GntR family transcriptional regulator [Subtercola endophyticus]UFS58728.1 FadR family transcriptional regulator [Subtercola endophyticus]